VNPAAERLLGYHASELLAMDSAGEILLPGEGERLVAELQRISDLPKRSRTIPRTGWRHTLNAYVRFRPASAKFSHPVEAQGWFLLPGHPAHLRHARRVGALTGLVAVALDQSATMRQEQALRESQERYRDLFENSSEMIATLSPSGQFLYANPTWKRCFGQDVAGLLALESFEALFGPPAAAKCGPLPARFGRRGGDRAPLRHHTPTAGCWNWS